MRCSQHEIKISLCRCSLWRQEPDRFRRTSNPEKWIMNKCPILISLLVVPGTKEWVMWEKRFLFTVCLFWGCACACVARIKTPLWPGKEGSRGSCDRSQTGRGAYALHRGHAGVVIWPPCPLRGTWTQHTPSGRRRTCSGHRKVVLDMKKYLTQTVLHSSLEKYCVHLPFHFLILWIL